MFHAYVHFKTVKHAMARPVASLKTAGHRSQAMGTELTPTRVVTKSPSHTIAARGPGGALQAPPEGSGAEPQPPTILGHFGLKWKHLAHVLYVPESCVHYLRWISGFSRSSPSL